MPKPDSTPGRNVRCWRYAASKPAIHALPALIGCVALFAGLGEDEVIALAESFAIENCGVREPLVDLLRKDLADRVAG